MAGISPAMTPEKWFNVTERALLPLSRVQMIAAVVDASKKLFDGFDQTSARARHS
jgi:hypothetical protein